MRDRSRVTEDRCFPPAPSEPRPLSWAAGDALRRLTPRGTYPVKISPSIRELARHVDAQGSGSAGGNNLPSRER